MYKSSLIMEQQKFVRTLVLLQSSAAPQVCFASAEVRKMQNFAGRLDMTHGLRCLVGCTCFSRKRAASTSAPFLAASDFRATLCWVGSC